MRPLTRVEIHEIPGAFAHSRPSRVREDHRVLAHVPTERTYGFVVPADPGARLAAFTAFVRRALDRARTTRGWSVERVAREAGIGVNTVYLWRGGTDWKQFPKGENVEAFCDALNIPPAAAYMILWPGKSERPGEPEPLGPEPELVTLARKLADPNVSEQEKFLIRETVRGLASRPSTSSEAPRRRNAG
jgi:transcriptional regulator with XRE-family HTH domain